MDTFTKNLQPGNFGPDVYKLQNILEKFGFGDFVPTGYFGPKTQEAVLRLQRHYLISPATGNLGPLTRELLNRLTKNNRTILHTTAIGCLGIDASPNDVAPDEYGCAETVNAIYEKAFGRQIGGTVSTYSMYEALQYSPEFIRVDIPLPGDIVISPTGHGNGNLSNGHVGIVFSSDQIMSNSSETGTFEKNYTVREWRERYVFRGGYPMVYFRKV